MAHTKQKNPIIEIITESFLKKVAPYYIFYCALNFLFDVALISMVAFFHFMLDHEISEVEEWLFLNSWELVIISKVAAFILTTIFLDSRVYIDSPFRNFLKQYMRWPGAPLIVAIICIWLMIGVYGDFQTHAPPLESGYRQVISYLGTSIFYLLDYIIIGFLCSIFKHFQKRERLAALILFPLLFFFSSLMKIAYVQNISLMVFVHAVTMFLFRYHNLKRWVGGACYVLCVVAPMSLFIGEDLLWGEKISLYTLENKGLLFCAIWPLLWGYLIYSIKKDKLTSR